jgi:diaminopimelate epimerase
LINFTKVQGAGNDFVLIEDDGAARDWTKLTPAMCDRHFGIGGDGLLLVIKSIKADCRMRVFNLDGSEADACGNGTRCVVRYVLEKGLVKPRGGEITVETMSGVRRVRVGSGKKPTIQVFMGKPIFAAKDIPVKIGQGNKELDIMPVLDYPLTIGRKKLLLNCVSMGNPHAVYFIDTPVADYPLAVIGPQMEKHRIFPKHVNFEIVRLLNRTQIEARVWERGVGETLACGSGACAIAVMARMHDAIDNKVDINLPGGTLNIEWDGQGEVMLSGPAKVVFSGEWPD